MLAVIITALASSSIYASRNMKTSRARLEAVRFLQGELEYLLSLTYDSLATGSRTTEAGTSSWVVEDKTAYRKILLKVSYAPSGGTPVVDSIVSFRKAP